MPWNFLHIPSNLVMQFRIVEVFSSEMPDCSGVPQGSVLCPLRFFIYINGLSITSRGYFFADDATLICPCKDVATLLEDLGQAFVWPIAGACNLTWLNVNIFTSVQMLHSFWTYPITRDGSLFFLVWLGHVQSFAQGSKVTSNTRQRLALLSRIFIRLTTELFILAYSMIRHLHLECYLQTRSNSLSKDINKLKRLLRVATRRIHAMRKLYYNTRSDCLQLLSLERWWVCGGLIRVFTFVYNLSNASVESFIKPRSAGNRRGCLWIFYFVHRSAHALFHYFTIELCAMCLQENDHPGVLPADL